MRQDILNRIGPLLDGRALPADLVVLLELAEHDPEGRLQATMGQLGATFIDPATSHPLLDGSYLNEADRADPFTMANVAAIDGVLSSAVIVVGTEDVRLYGYWLHPAETADPPPILRLDSEGQFAVCPGAGLTEAVIADGCSDDESAFRATVQLFSDAGVQVAARAPGDVTEPVVVVHPAVLHDTLYQQELARRTPPTA